MSVTFTRPKPDASPIAVVTVNRFPNGANPKLSHKLSEIHDTEAPVSTTTEMMMLFSLANIASRLGLGRFISLKACRYSFALDSFCPYYDNLTSNDNDLDIPIPYRCYKG